MIHTQESGSEVKYSRRFFAQVKINFFIFGFHNLKNDNKDKRI